MRAPFVITMSQPAAITIPAAASFVAMPPVPRQLPAADLLGQCRDPVDQMRLRIGARVGVIQPVDVAQQHQKIRMAEPRHDGRQRVVIAEHLVLTSLNFRRRHRVVFVHDRNDAHFRQGRERRLQMRRARRIGHIVIRQQDLPDRMPIFREKFIIGEHQPALPDRRRRLLEPQLARPLGKAQLVRPDGDGAGADQNHLMPHIL